MPTRFSARMKSVRRDWQGSRSALNELFRASLLAVAHHWISNMLPLHFGNGAINRYGYKFRSRSYLAKKQRLRPDLVPPAPLELTGELKSHVMGNARSGQMLNASKAISTGTSQKNPNGKLRVRIPVSIPHPINPANRGELTRIIRAERRELHRVLTAEVNRRLLTAPMVTTTTKVA